MSARMEGVYLHSIRMRLLDDVSNYILLTYDYDLIF
jgi:hypothetical protein